MQRLTEYTSRFSNKWIVFGVTCLQEFSVGPPMAIAACMEDIRSTYQMTEKQCKLLIMLGKMLLSNCQENSDLLKIRPFFWTPNSMQNTIHFDHDCLTKELAIHKNCLLSVNVWSVRPLTQAVEPKLETIRHLANLLLMYPFARQAVRR